MSTKKKVSQPKKSELIEYCLWLENDKLYFQLVYIDDKFYKWIDKVNLEGDTDCYLDNEGFGLQTDDNPLLNCNCVSVTNDKYTKNNISMTDESLKNTYENVHEVISQSVLNYKKSLTSPILVKNNKGISINKSRTTTFKV